MWSWTVFLSNLEQFINECLLWSWTVSLDWDFYFFGIFLFALTVWFGKIDYNSGYPVFLGKFNVLHTKSAWEKKGLRLSE